MLHTSKQTCQTASRLQVERELAAAEAAERGHQQSHGHDHSQTHEHGHDLKHDHDHTSSSHDCTPGCTDPTHDHSHDHGHAHHKPIHDDAVSSVSFVIDGAMDLTKLNMWLGALLEMRGNDIYRMKGILNIKDDVQRFVFQVCPHGASLSRLL